MPIQGPACAPLVCVHGADPRPSSLGSIFGVPHFLLRLNAEFVQVLWCWAEAFPPAPARLAVPQPGFLVLYKVWFQLEEKPRSLLDWA